MTIIVGIATPEGLVLAGDSRTTYDMKTYHRIASDRAQKLFTVSKMGVATFGLAFIGRDTIAGIMDQFAVQVGTDSNDIHDFALNLGEFFSERFRAECLARGMDWDVDSKGWPLGFLVAGYDREGIGHIKGVYIPGKEIDDELAINTADGGSLWRGQTDMIGRLVKGVDLRRLDELDIEVTEEMERELERLEYRPLRPITIQDGIDYAAFLVRTTIDMQRFSDGTVLDERSVPTCGGPLQLLAVERSGPKWVASLTPEAPSYPGQAEGGEPIDVRDGRVPASVDLSRRPG